jgi:hypothetical protein
MVRFVALVTLALALSAAPLHAQSSIFTVTVSAAKVHKGPGLTSPVIGYAPRHTVLRVLKKLGSWNAVLWTDSPTGLGYVHITTGRLGVSAASSRAASTSRPASPRPVAGQATAAPAPTSTPAPAPLTTTQVTPVGDRVPSSVPEGESRINHVVGVGGMVGSMSSWGVTGRWWRDKHLGIQAAFTRDAMTSDVAPGRVTATQIEPAVVYAPYDYVPGYVGLRPYVGSGLSFRRQTLKDALREPVSDRGVGFHVFGGTELTFAGVTRFGLSAEAGYRHQPAPFAGFEPDRFALAIAGHWYIK